MKKKIKLMAEYQSYPLWQIEDHNTDNIAPASLPLSEETILRLECWADTYDSTLNFKDPISSGFSNEQQKQKFEQEGINLWRRLQEELSPDYEVVYYSDALGKLLSPSNKTKHQPEQPRE